MRVRHSPKLTVYALLAATGIALGLLSGRPALAAFAAPFSLYVIWALGSRSALAVSGDAGAGRGRLIEGERTPVEVRLAVQGAARVDVALPVPAGVALESPGVGVRPSDGRAEVALDLRAERWGAYRLGPLTVRAWDPLGTQVLEVALGGQFPVRVYPAPGRVRALLSPRATGALTGSRRSAARGDGIEYADVSQYVPGDPIRAVNWRASGRRGELYVTRRHPERNADVVLLIDGLGQVGGGDGQTLDDAVRVAAALAAPHLHARDRVAVVGLGTGVWWLQGALGVRQLYRIVDMLIESQAAVGFSWRDTSQIDRRVLPAGALVLAVSPLLARRSARVLLELRARGHDVAVVEIAPDRFDAPAADRDAALARRIWLLSREAQRRRLHAHGIAVARFDGPPTLDRAVQEVNRWRATAQRRTA